VAILLQKVIEVVLLISASKFIEECNRLLSDERQTQDAWGYACIACVSQ